MTDTTDNVITGNFPAHRQGKAEARTRPSQWYEGETQPRPVIPLCEVEHLLGSLTRGLEALAELSGEMAANVEAGGHTSGEHLDTLVRGAKLSAESAAYLERTIRARIDFDGLRDHTE